jgi:hypothetical protein
MTTPEYSEPRRDSAELPIDFAQQLAGIQHTCETTISGILGAAERDEASRLIVAEVGRIVEAEAVAAAEADNNALFEQHLNTLIRLSGLPNKNLAGACLAGVSIGNQRAFSLLESILAGEKNKVQRKMDSEPSEFDQFPETEYTTGKSLRSLMHVYAEKGIPPDAWIERVAINPQHQWTLTMEYFDILKEKGKLGTDDVRAQHAAEANKLLDRTTFPDSFLFAMTRHALDAITDADVRAQLMSNFRDAVLEQTPYAALSRFPVVIETAHRFASVHRPNGSTFAEDSAMRDIQQTVDELTGLMSVAGLDMTAAVESFDWEIGKKVYEGATPQQLVETMNAQAAKLLEETDYEPVIITSRMDGLLEKYAELYASRGDFAAAAFFVANTSNEFVMYRALEDCLKQAKTLEDVQALRPDELSLQTERDLDFQFKVAEGRMAGNAEALTQLSRDIAAAIGEDPPEPHLYDLLQTIQKKLLEIDRLQALALTKEWLAALRAKQENSTLYQGLSATLINSGDAAEAIEAFKDLDNGASLRAEQKLHALWLLSRSIRTTFPGLPEHQPGTTSESVTQSETTEESDAMLRFIRRILDTLE